MFRLALTSQKFFSWSILFSIIVLLKFDTLHQVPVWDSAMSIFPAANYLYENHFNYMLLFEQQGWHDAMPNVHSLSPLTFITALVMKFTDGNELMFPILHLFQFAITAILLCGLYQFIKPVLKWKIAVLVCAATFVNPIFWVQTGYMYLEIAIAACGVYAFLYWTEEKYYKAAFCVVLSCLLKSSGLAILATLVFVIIIEKKPLKQRVLSIVFLSIVPLGIEILKKLTSASIGPVKTPNYSHYIDNEFILRLSNIPDVAILIGVALCGFLIMAIKRPHVLFNSFLTKQAIKSINYQRRLLSYIIVIMFLLLLLTIPLTGAKFYPLSRYYVLIIPFLMFIFADTARFLFYSVFYKSYGKNRLLKSDSMTIFSLFFLILFFVLNKQGEYYPGSLGVTGFSIVERSEQYKDFLTAQKHGINMIAGIQNIPVFVNRPDYYYATTPIMGYSEKKMKNVIFILNKPFEQANLSDYPEHFYLLYSYHWHGCEVMRRVAQNAQASPDYIVNNIDKFQINKFRTSLWEVHRKDL